PTPSLRPAPARPTPAHSAPARPTSPRPTPAPSAPPRPAPTRTPSPSPRTTAPAPSRDGAGSSPGPTSPPFLPLALLLAGATALLAVRRARTPRATRRELTYLAMGIRSLQKGEHDKAIARFQTALSVETERADEIRGWLCLA